MGGLLSTKKDYDHRLKLLIGELNNKSQEEQKYFMLSRTCLTDSNHVSHLDKTKDGTLQNPGQEHTIENGNNVFNEQVHTADGDSPQEKTEPLFIPILGRKTFWLTQTYRSWHAIMDLEKLFKRKKQSLYLVQLDDMPDFIVNFSVKFGSEHMNLYQVMQKFMQIFFSGMTIKWLSNINTKERNWKITSRIHSKTEHEQQLVKDIFPYLKKVCPSDGYAILSLTWTDLYPSEDMNFVLGEASNQQKACVVSFGRWETKNFDKETHKDLSCINTDVLWKFFKCCSHEMCHLFGLGHCDFFQCMMNESNSVEEALNQPMFLCPVCIRKLQNVCKFDIKHRYTKLLEFVEEINNAFPSNKWKTSLEWLHKMIQFLNCET